ncbi:MAG: NINE protein [Phycisphaerales bacterium]|nr:NINE protein [Phycisphaerales bacterium]
MNTKGVSYLLWFLCFVGVAGVHRFYNGKWITGILWLLTGGLFMVGQVVDLILIPFMVERRNRRVLEGTGLYV